MWVDGDEGRRSDAGVDGVRHETFAKASDDDIVREGGETSEVRDGLEPLLHAHPGGLPVHGRRGRREEWRRRGRTREKGRERGRRVSWTATSLENTRLY